LGFNYIAAHDPASGMKFVLANPGVGPFVQQTARALLEADLLANYWTTFADQPGASWRRALVRIALGAGINIEPDLQRRTVTEVPETILKLAARWELITSLLRKLNADRRFIDAIWEQGIFSFDRIVARRGLKNVSAIYGYEYSSLASFNEAVTRGLARVYEVPSPEHEFVEGLIQREIEKFPELDDGKRGYFLVRQKRRTERRRREWALADLVIVNSTFTRESYAAAGLDVRKVRVIPLGAPQICMPELEGDGVPSGPLRVLWAGTFGIHKGAHYLLSAWRKLAAGKKAVLQIFGANNLPRALTADAASTIEFSPTIPRTALFERYRAADVLVFPTLCDGFGMVVTEAFANGLPVITTTRAGAADLVRHGENGLVVPPGDSQALLDALEWCLVNRTKLKAMRRAARDTAARWQWDDFRRRLACDVVEGLREAGYTE
jgi:glycosyltransferase involved in cell wall biosynthesis